MKKLAMWVFVTALFVGIFLGAFADMSQTPRAFYGSKEFLTFEDAQEYQRILVNTALAYNAKVISADISITSPPEFSFHIILPISESTPSIFNGDWQVAIPQESSFPYGNRVVGAAGAWVGISIIGLFCLGAISFFTWLIWQLVVEADNNAGQERSKK